MIPPFSFLESGAFLAVKDRVSPGGTARGHCCEKCGSRLGCAALCAGGRSGGKGARARTAAQRAKSR